MSSIIVLQKLSVTVVMNIYIYGCIDSDTSFVVPSGAVANCNVLANLDPIDVWLGFCDTHSSRLEMGGYTFLLGIAKK